MTNNELSLYRPGDEQLDLVAIRMDSAKYPRIKSLPPAESVAGLAQIITGALAYSGRQVPEEDVRYMAASLHSELMQDYDGVGTANITIDEVRYCVRRATLGLGPEMYGINVASIYKVICDYCLNEGRQAQVTAYNRRRAEREKALKASAAGAMLQVYSGKLLNHTTTKK